MLLPCPRGRLPPSADGLSLSHDETVIPFGRCQRNKMAVLAELTRVEMEQAYVVDIAYLSHFDQET